MREWFGKLRRAFQRSAIAEELREEIETHFEMEVQEKIARGISPEEVRRRFGNQAYLKEQAMDRWSFGFADILLQDLRYAVRTLVRAPAFTVVALLSLAVGIGASAGIFGAMNALLSKALPLLHPDRLVMIWPRDSSAPRPSFGFYHSMFLRFRERADMFGGVSASWIVDRSNVMLDGNAAGPLSAGLVSGDYFDTLGVPAALGRTFTRDDERPPGGSSVAVISYDFWQRKFGGTRDVVGRTLRLNQILFTIVGVTQRGFQGD